VKCLVGTVLSLGGVHPVAQQLTALKQQCRLHCNGVHAVAQQQTALKQQ
jgi:hypothetical protein